MSQRDTILGALTACIQPDDRLLVIHSSLPHLRFPHSVGKWDFLYAVRVLLDEGRTLAFPTFTFSFCKGQPYHHRASLSESGVLGDWVLELAGFARTRHPIYSFAVAGPLAPELMSCPNTTTFGDDSIFAAFERWAGRILVLGCDWGVCTQVHRYEDEAQIPYRYYKDFAGRADFGAGGNFVQARMFVRDLDLDAIKDFSPVIERLRAVPTFLQARLWCGTVESVTIADLALACREALAGNAWSLVANGQQAAYRLACRQQSAKAPALRVAVLGSANLELIGSGLRAELAALLPDRRVELFMPPYGQMQQEVLSPASTLSRFAGDYTFFVDRLEDLVGAPSLEGIDANRLEAVANHYVATVRTYRRAHGGWIIVNRFARLAPSALRQADERAGDSLSALVRRLDTQLENELGGLAQVHLFDTGGAAVDYTGGAVLDPRLWFLGRFSFSDGFSRFLANRYAGVILADLGRTARLIVVDLDNTLWGGVLGEDDIKGLKLGGDYPGNAFLALQRILKRLSERGVALAVCSKNDEEHALSAMRTLPAMLLKPDDFVAHRINWRPKWQNVVEICDELSLGLENVLFVDDNPVERELMRQRLPQVKVLDLPDDPAFYAQVLLHSSWIEALTITAEDANRVQSYRARQAVQGLRASSDDLGAFYASLDVRLILSPLDASNMSRAVQLVNKTNQFNATTRRYDQRQLEQMIATGDSVVLIGMEDKFNEFENIGVLIVRWNHPGPGWAAVDTYLLSCRVLGRGIETGVLYWLMDLARARHMVGLVGEVIETERNAPVRSVFRDAGFSSSMLNGEWRLALDGDAGQAPTWITVLDRVSALGIHDATNNTQPRKNEP